MRRNAICLHILSAFAAALLLALLSMARAGAAFSAAQISQPTQDLGSYFFQKPLTIAQLQALFQQQLAPGSTDKLLVEDAAGASVTKGPVCTGYKMILCSEGARYSTTALVAGDLTGIGRADETAYLLLRSHLAGEATLQGLQAQAADMNQDGLLTVQDLLLLKKAVEGLS